MVVDKRARRWIVGCLVIFLVATAVYLPYAREPRGPHGGSRLGLAYGIAGSALILFAFLVSLRRRFRSLRCGNAFMWMQGHVWLGLLSYPLILYHAGFSWGGTLTSVLMWVFTIVVISGITGLVIQQYVPRAILREVPAVTIYEQIPHVIDRLTKDAESVLDVAKQRLTQPAPMLIGSFTRGGDVTSSSRDDMAALAAIDRFLRLEIKPFLAWRPLRKACDGRFSTSAKTAEVFQLVGAPFGAEIRSSLEQLREIVEERRQLERQCRLHRWLHLWLLLHVPLSYALVILAAYHAVQAVRFATIGR